MKFRLNFDDQISAALIAKIARRADGGSLNKSLQIMIIEWSALEDARKAPGNDLITAENPPSDQVIEAALASIDNEW